MLGTVLQVTHLGYYETEEEAARVYDRVSISLHGPHAQTNYPAADAARILGLRTEQIAEALGSVPYEEIVHRDNLIVIV